MTKIGIEHNKYYRNTWKENDQLAKAWLFQQEEQWKRTRNIEFRILQSTIVNNGKKFVPAFKVEKPTDLYLFSGEQETGVNTLEGVEGEKFLKNLFAK